jgi:hypothetical protein
VKSQKKLMKGVLFLVRKRQNPFSDYKDDRLTDTTQPPIKNILWKSFQLVGGAKKSLRLPDSDACDPLQAKKLKKLKGLEKEKSYKVTKGLRGKH